MLSFIEKPLSNRTGAEVMKMAVVQVAPALVLMGGVFEYWWTVCSCQLGNQISSCLRSPNMLQHASGSTVNFWETC